MEDGASQVIQKHLKAHKDSFEKMREGLEGIQETSDRKGADGLPHRQLQVLLTYADWMLTYLSAKVKWVLKKEEREGKREVEEEESFSLLHALLLDIACHPATSMSIKHAVAKGGSKSVEGDGMDAGKSFDGKSFDGKSFDGKSSSDGKSSDGKSSSDGKPILERRIVTKPALHGLAHLLVSSSLSSTSHPYPSSLGLPIPVPFQ